MGQVAVTINDRRYNLSCDDGQEDHVSRLASDIDLRVRELSEAVGPVGEARLILLAALILADELFEARGGRPPAPTRAPTQIDESLGQTATGEAQIPAAAEEAALATDLISLATRIEAVVARLKAT